MTIKLKKNSYEKLGKPMDEPGFLNAYLMLIRYELEASWDKRYIRTRCAVSRPL